MSDPVLEVRFVNASPDDDALLRAVVGSDDGLEEEARAAIVLREDVPVVSGAESFHIVIHSSSGFTFLTLRFRTFGWVAVGWMGCSDCAGMGEGSDGMEEEEEESGSDKGTACARGWVVEAGAGGDACVNDDIVAVELVESRLADCEYGVGS